MSAPLARHGRILHVQSVDRVTSKGHGMLDAFQCAGWGSLLIGADGSVIGLNEEAQRHVDSVIGLGQGQIAARHRPSNAKLQRLIAAALSSDYDPSVTTTEGVLLPRPDGYPLMAYVIPIAEHEGDPAQRTMAIVVLLDSAKHREPAESVLREAFGLTLAETRIAIDFARGRDLQEIANDQGLSIGTVRKHFKEVLAKTNTSRQAELAFLLARLAQWPREQHFVPAARDQHTKTRPTAEQCSSGK